MSMTDEQIVKALECCVRYENYLACRGCPFSESGVCEEDGLALQKYSLDLIKRQQAEIESLEADYENVYKQASADLLASIADGGTSCEWCIDKHRAEAVREFAEKLKEKYIHNTTSITSLVTLYDNIDNLVREMTEKEGGKG